jgi:hypothetical protein
MSPPATANSSSFPHWVALGSLGLVLWLFFGNTVPALHEREQLRSLTDELQDLRRRYEGAIAEARLGQGGSTEYDLQALFVAIDQRGYTPAELCAAYPAPEGDADSPTRTKVQ